MLGRTIIIYHGGWSIYPSHAPGQVRASNVPSYKQLSEVTALIKRETSFTVRPKKHAGLETILDATKVDVGHIAYDLLRYFILRYNFDAFEPGQRFIYTAGSFGSFFIWKHKSKL